MYFMKEMLDQAVEEKIGRARWLYAQLGRSFPPILKSERFWTITLKPSANRGRPRGETVLCELAPAAPPSPMGGVDSRA